MQELEVEIASVARMMVNETGIEQIYFNNIPDGFDTPCIYFPIPEISGTTHSLSAYGIDFTEYVNVFADTTEEAAALATKAITYVLANGWRVPIVDDSGNQTTKTFYLNQPKMKEIESGVIEIEFSWKKRSAYIKADANKVERFFYDMQQKND